MMKLLTLTLLCVRTHEHIRSLNLALSRSLSVTRSRSHTRFHFWVSVFHHFLHRLPLNIYIIIFFSPHFISSYCLFAQNYVSRQTERKKKCCKNEKRTRPSDTFISTRIWIDGMKSKGCMKSNMEDFHWQRIKKNEWSYVHKMNFSTTSICWFLCDEGVSGSFCQSIHEFLFWWIWFVLDILQQIFCVQHMVCASSLRNLKIEKQIASNVAKGLKWNQYFAAWHSRVEK